MVDKVIAIVDLGFGSSGKGLLAGSFAHVTLPDTCIHANHPNAGHTFRTGDRKYVFRMTCNSFIVPSCGTMLIGPGAVLDIDVLIDELLQLRDEGLLEDKQVVIHPNAAFLTPENVVAESRFVAIGSTMKGSAEAVIQKMRRNPSGVGIVDAHKAEVGLRLARAGLQGVVRVDRELYQFVLATSKLAIVEGAQGSSLSVHSRFYPYCTSRDVSVNQLFADCALPRFDKLDVIVAGTIRTYPIRVANRFNAAGEQIGTSGPCYPDQFELDWKVDLNREPELTTVTKLPRRIFTFSDQQLTDACRVNRPDFIYLSFCDYLAQDSGVNQPIPHAVKLLRDRIQWAVGVPVRALSYGPRMEDVRVAFSDHQYEFSRAVIEEQAW
jgi:adenylosuccinate synthase